MLLGEYTHTMDPKNRLSLPARFRKELGKTLVVTRGLDKCLFAYSPKAWEKIVSKFSDLSLARSGTRGVNRFFLSGASELDIDAAGRVLLPEVLVSFAGLSSKVVLAGVNDRIEMWDEARWKAYTSTIEKDADALAEQLGELGAL
jgi:MraZ protein